MMPRTTPANPMRIIGCGRWLRRDDQVGLLVAEALSARALPDADVMTSESPGSDISLCLDGVELLVLIDAADYHGEIAPGQWRRIDYRLQARRIRTRHWTSTHTLGLDSALRLADALGVLPPTVWIYAVCIADAAFGHELTGQVDASIEPLAEAIARDVARWRQESLCHA